MITLEQYKADNNRGFILAMASDHAGVDMKAFLAHKLRAVGSRGHFVLDHGPATADRVDYPDYAALVATSVLRGEVDRGILICGSGVGMSMAANRYPGIRCVLANDVTTARLSRQHNNANVLALGARLTGPDLAWEIVREWLQTPYEGGRHDQRIAKMDQT